MSVNSPLVAYNCRKETKGIREVLKQLSLNFQRHQLKAANQKLEQGAGQNEMLISMGIWLVTGSRHFHGSAHHKQRIRAYGSREFRAYVKRTLQGTLYKQGICVRTPHYLGFLLLHSYSAKIQRLCSRRR